VRKKRSKHGLAASQLVVPIVRAGEQALDNAEDTGATHSSFNAPLARAPFALT
jgi:hypothetical protein